MLAVHCVSRRENLVGKNVAPKLHEILYSIIKCIKSIKANAKAQRLFQRFCEAYHAYHRQWLVTRRLSHGENLS